MCADTDLRLGQRVQSNINNLLDHLPTWQGRPDGQAALSQAGGHVSEGEVSEPDQQTRPRHARSTAPAEMGATSSHLHNPPTTTLPGSRHSRRTPTSTTNTSSSLREPGPHIPTLTPSTIRSRPSELVENSRRPYGPFRPNPTQRRPESTFRQQWRE